MVFLSFKRRLWIAAGMCFSLLGTLDARANTISAIGGLAFGRSSGLNELKSQPPLLGAEYMLDLLPSLQIGGFYQKNFLSYRSGENGAIYDMGASLRFSLEGAAGIHSGPFVDAGAGIARRTQGENSSGGRFSYGAGAGYEIPLALHLSLSPHVGVRMLPDSVATQTNSPVIDGDVLFSVRF